jgi:hypothetical protein
MEKDSNVKGMVQAPASNSSAIKAMIVPRITRVVADPDGLIIKLYVTIQALSI